MRNLVIVFFVLINLAGFTLALLDNTESRMNEGSYFSIPCEIRVLTLSAFGGGVGSYAGCVVSGGGFACTQLKGALQLIIVQNLLSLMLAFRAFKRKKKGSSYGRSSLSLK